MRYINKQQEEAIKQAWKKEAMRYDSTKLDKIHAHVLTAARSFYNEIKKDLVKQESENIAAYSIDKFPSSLKENNTAMAWIMRMGNNRELFNRLFPNQVYSYYNYMKKLDGICYEPILYKDDHRKLEPEIDINRVIELTAQYEEVLVVLRYLLTCDKTGIDSLEYLNIKPPMIGKVHKIIAETKYYSIRIEFTGNVNKPYNKIWVRPHRSILSKEA